MPAVTINSLDADVPIIPPIVILLLAVICALLAKFVDRNRFLPDALSSLKIRASLFALLAAGFIQIHLGALDALHGAGSGLAFTPTAGIATDGPYAYTRNPFYVLIVFVQMPAVAILCDCAWLIFAIAPLFVWLSKVVIPGEEAFLARHYGAQYETYMETTPRWLF